MNKIIVTIKDEISAQSIDVEIPTEQPMETLKYDIAEAVNGRTAPEWLEVDSASFSGTVSSLPKREQIDVPVDEMMIVELYSK